MKLKTVKRFDGGTLFAGANSGRGFVSFYDSIINDKSIERTYILKGGPGTGKSHFMREAVKYAETHGMAVEKYNCSSDPDSLDAVVICGAERGSIAILDGTAPHALEATLAGARDELIDLGRFWDPEALSLRREKITELIEKKQENYKRAYRYLEACGNVRDIMEKLITPCFLKRKAEKSVGRIFSEIKKGGGYEIDRGIISCIGMKGRIRYDTYEKYADNTYVIEDFYGLGHMYLALLVEEARKSDTPVRISYDPIDCKRLDVVFFENDKTAFVIDRGIEAVVGERRINMKRFADAERISDIRAEYRFNSKLEDALTDAAIECLEDAGKYHFELEKIYSECMDFEAKEVFCRNFLDNIFKF